jgi:membrane protease YdiL (CAAX protease family)
MLSSTVLFAIWAALRPGDTKSIGYLACGLVGLWFGFIGVPVYAARRKGSGRLSRDFGLRVEPVDAALGAAGAIAALIAEALVVALVRALSGPVKVSQDVGDAIKRAEGPAVVVAFVLTVIAVPIVEELFFRGLLLRSLGKRFGAVVAIVGSSAVFGLAHYQGDVAARTAWTVVAGLFAVGVVLAVLAQRTGRLGPGIVAHSLFNLLAFISLVRSG